MSYFNRYYANLHPELKSYFEILSPEFPKFLIPYINTQIMQRLDRIGYFCGMTRASKAIYNFKYELSRLDHSISSALIVWHFTSDKTQTIAALFHDVGTPAFAHVIDYLNKDYTHQSTEIDLTDILYNDSILKCLLLRDQIDIEDIIDYKQFSLVDNQRPKICADRLDGIFLTSLVWTQKTNLEEIEKIYQQIDIDFNLDGEPEYYFMDEKSVFRLIELNDEITKLCYSDEDFYMMTLLANIVKKLIKYNIIKYEDLWITDDYKLFDLIEQLAKVSKEFTKMYQDFTTIKTIKPQNKPSILNDRRIKPLVMKK